MTHALLVTGYGDKVELDLHPYGPWLSITEHGAGGHEGYAAIAVTREQVVTLRDALSNWLNGTVDCASDCVCKD